jgi:membrane protein DedA with SNARE-associated domain
MKNYKIIINIIFYFIYILIYVIIITWRWKKEEIEGVCLRLQNKIQ